MANGRTKAAAILLVSLLTVALVGAVGCSKSQEMSAKSEGLKMAKTEEPAAKSVATDVAARRPDPNAVVAMIDMAKGGEIVIEFYPEDAPKTVDNFITLANKGFYNGLTFHRVVPGFVVQGGDPAGNGTGDAGYNIPAEFNKQKHLTGTVAMARSSDPNSASCQFYICLAPQPGLDGKYTVFGQTIQGMDIVKGIKIGDVMKTVRILPKSEYKK